MKTSTGMKSQDWFALATAVIVILSSVFAAGIGMKPRENSFTTRSPEGHRHDVSIGTHRDFVTVTNITWLNGTAWVEMPVTAEPILLLDEVKVGDVVAVRSMGLNHATGVGPQHDHVLVGHKVENKE